MAALYCRRGFLVFAVALNIRIAEALGTDTNAAAQLGALGSRSKALRGTDAISAAKEGHSSSFAPVHGHTILPGRLDGGCRLPQWLEPAIAQGGGRHGQALLSLAKRQVLTRNLNSTSVDASAGQQLLVAFEGFETDDSGGPMVFVDCSRGKALVFVHIPKNAGCHIEATARAGGVLWGAVKVRAAPFASESVRAPDGNTCSTWHLPPYLYQGAMYKNSEVFCVLRDPAARAVSEFRWRQDIRFPGTPMSCDEGTMSTWVQKQIMRLHSQRYHSDCHWVPQADYVRDPNTHQRTCHVMLKLSNLEPQFNALMKSRGLALRMKPSAPHSNKADSCPWLTPAQLSPAAMSLIRSTYSADYGLLEKAGVGLIPPAWKSKPKPKPIVKKTYSKPFSPPAKAEPSLQTPSTAPASTSKGTSLRAQPNLCMRAVARAEMGYVVHSGDTLGLGQCGGAADQMFVIHDDQTVRLKSKPQFCLSVFLRGPVAHIGDKLGMYPCAHDTSAWSQRFIAPKDGSIRLSAPRAQHLCLSIFLAGDEAAPNDEIGLYTCTGAWNQVFTASA